MGGKKGWEGGRGGNLDCLLHENCNLKTLEFVLRRMDLETFSLKNSVT